MVVQTGRHPERVFKPPRARKRLQVSRAAEPQPPVPAVVPELVVGADPRVALLGVLDDGQVIRSAPVYRAGTPVHHRDLALIDEIHQPRVHPNAFADVLNALGVERRAAAAVAQRLQTTHDVLLRQERDHLEVFRHPRLVFQRVHDARAQRELAALEPRANGGAQRPRDVRAVQRDAFGEQNACPRCGFVAVAGAHPGRLQHVVPPEDIRQVRRPRARVPALGSDQVVRPGGAPGTGGVGVRASHHMRARARGGGCRKIRDRATPARGARAGGGGRGGGGGGRAGRNTAHVSASTRGIRHFAVSSLDGDA